MPKDLTYIAKTNFRNKEQIFGIKRPDRRQHMYVIGKTGSGKTAFLKNMALQDIQNGQGLAIIDPHGEFVEEVLDNIPPHRINDVVYFNPADMEFPVSFNIMDVADPKYKHLIASGLIGIFTKIWANVWSARMEYILANCILALLDTPGTTLLGIPRMLVDRDYRQKIINNLKDPVVKSFWVNEYEEWESRYRNEAIAPVQNKVGQFLNVSFVRNIVGQAKNTIDIEDIMNNQKILLVNVSKGRIGEDNSAILGAMLITKIQLSAMERVRIPEDERKDFYMYVDEFQNFATDSFVNILSEARKYRLDLIIAHQYIGQLVTDTSTAVRDAVFGNVGTMITFRVGAADAEFLEQEYMPEFLQNDLIRLPNYNVYLKLMIDGIASRPFSAKTIAPAPTVKDDKKRTEIIKISRSKYAHTLRSVEDEINRWASNLEVPVSNAQNSSDLSNPQADLSNPQNGPKPFYKPTNQNNSKASDGTKLYDVKCSSCGKDTKVIFEPVAGRPVYCKSCLKKLKAGEIAPASGVAPGRPVSRQDSMSGSDGRENRPSPQVKWTNDAPVQASAPAQVGYSRDKQSGDSALADLGIEFSAPLKIEPISFNRKNVVRDFKNTPPQKEVKRKEINLSELRQALEASLMNKEAPDKGAPEKFDYKPKNPKEELEARIVEEKYEDKSLPPSPKPEDKNNTIKPEETIKL
ncbi:MAG: type IV secretion system DNA-binding domain-containing protein [Candidatus Staskawiczbacteria bacterium]|nr:type IV secretion system DNA-binding domain-containing protein [Candidatus Staskawiczbacteria bacterium]